jgi:hypothetical protein
VTRLELHQHIDVAVGVEVIADRRSKQRQPRDRCRSQNASTAPRSMARLGVMTRS